MTLSPAKAAALQEVQSALGAVRDAQRSETSPSTVPRCSASTTEAMGKFDAAK